MPVELERIRKLNGREERADRDYVLYWAQMNRRVDANHGLLRAVEIANRLQLPVLHYEGVTCSYPYANDREHTCMLQGVPETAKRLNKLGIGYVFYLRPNRDSPNDILYRLARNAAALVTDDYPTFIASQHNASVPAKLDIPYYVVDSSCIVPMSQLGRREFGAYTIRPKINRLLPQYLHAPGPVKVESKFTRVIPDFHVEVTVGSIPKLVATCEIDHSVGPSPSFDGGRLAAEKLLSFFLNENLKRFDRDRNKPAKHATSHMSPYLHFGQMSSLEIALAVREHALEHHVMADEYLEELIVRRELAFNYVRHVEQPDRLENLPNWALETMKQHTGDKRDAVDSTEQLA